MTTHLQQSSRWLLTRRWVQRPLRRLLNWYFRESYDYWRGDTPEGPCFFGRRVAKIGRWQIAIHAFLRADNDDEFHSHPVHAYRFVLSGGYVEEVLTTPPGRYPAIIHPVTLHEGQFGPVGPDYVHRLHKVLDPVHWQPRPDGEPDVPEAPPGRPTYTLWISGPKVAKTALHYPRHPDVPSYCP